MLWTISLYLKCYKLLNKRFIIDNKNKEIISLYEDIYVVYINKLKKIWKYL